MGSTVVELVIFKIKSGASRADFDKAVAKSNLYLENCPGFVDRELSVTEDGERWADLLHWESMEAATKAAEGIFNANECHDFLQMLDEKSIQMFHLKPVMTKASSLQRKSSAAKIS
jgi:heme-degrading monooxygenase HmoA